MNQLYVSNQMIKMRNSIEIKGLLMWTLLSNGIQNIQSNLYLQNVAYLMQFACRSHWLSAGYLSLWTLITANIVLLICSVIRNKLQLN